jgi:hypothetical protein
MQDLCVEQVFFFMARCALSSAAFQNFHSIWRLKIQTTNIIDVEHTLELRVTVSTIYPSVTLLTICDISWSSLVLHRCSYGELHVLLYDRFSAFQFKTSYSDIKQCFTSLKVGATLLEILLVETSTVILGSQVSFVRGVIWLLDGRLGARIWSV